MYWPIAALNIMKFFRTYLGSTIPEHDFSVAIIVKDHSQRDAVVRSLKKEIGWLFSPSLTEFPDAASAFTFYGIKYEVRVEDERK